MFVYVCVNLAVAWFFCETPQHCSSWPDHWSWHWTDLLLQSFHRWKQLEPPGHAHSAGACADFRADHGSRAVQCNFLASWMGGGQRPSKWKAILLQSKHTGDKVGTSLKCWKKIEGRSTLALRVWKHHESLLRDCERKHRNWDILKPVCISFGSSASSCAMWHLWHQQRMLWWKCLSMSLPKTARVNAFRQDARHAVKMSQRIQCTEWWLNRQGYAPAMVGMSIPSAT